MEYSVVYSTFYDKMKFLKQHLELSDLALRLANDKCSADIDETKSIREVLNASKHYNLSIKNVVRQRNALFAQSRYMLHEQTIVDVYRYFSWYIAHIIQEIAKKKPMEVQSLLASKEGVLTYPTIIQLGSYEAIITDMAKKVFRSLENKRSTPELVENLINITHISIDEDLKNTALFYLEIRHLIIHNDSEPDANFLTANNAGLVEINKNGKIRLCYDLSKTIIYKVIKLCGEIDQELKRLSLI